MADKHIDEATGVETVGHEWDGIEELNNPLPRWWLWTFYATIIFAVGYVVAYPAIPLLDKGTEGMLGWTSRGQLAHELDEQDARRASAVAGLGIVPIGKLQENEELMRAAVAGGRAAFKVNCVQCHGSGAAGVQGLYPNLNDDDWLWGGDLVEIEKTIADGIRQPDHDGTRFSIMPSFGRDGILTAPQVGSVVNHVLSLSGKGPVDARGAELFEQNCAVCHGSAGTGLREFGAPDLTDAIWLYGGSPADITYTVANARNSVMPAWGERLDPVTVKMLAAYVHSLGGGEDFVEEVAESPAEEVDERP
jgi:cytochrome c oxidase cbb3-type subunit 3